MHDLHYSFIHDLTISCFQGGRGGGGGGGFRGGGGGFRGGDRGGRVSNIAIRHLVIRSDCQHFIGRSWVR